MSNLNMNELCEQKRQERNSSHMRISANFVDSPLNKAITETQLVEDYISKSDQFSVLTEKGVVSYVNEALKGVDTSTEEGSVIEGQVMDLVKGMTKQFVKTDVSVFPVFIHTKPSPTTSEE